MDKLSSDDSKRITLAVCHELKRLGVLEDSRKEPPFTLENIQRLASIAEQKAGEIQVPIVFSAVDSGGNLILLHRMEGALLGSIDISINKAFTAAAFHVPTHELGIQAQPGQPLYGLEATNGGRIVLFGGGFPYWYDGILAGAIGISGGTAEQDMEIASTALQKFKEEI